jgi:hypothetical protein
MQGLTREMAAELLGYLGQAGTLIIGSLGLFIALRNQHRQLNVQMFIEFSGRFQELLRLFPTEAWLANRNPAQPMPPSSQELTDCTLYSIQFVADVYYLHKAGYLSKNLWRMWERGIQSTLSGQVFKREWDNLSVEFSHNQEFVRYIDGLVHGRATEMSWWKNL